MYRRPSPERASAVAQLARTRRPARVRPFTVTGGRTGAQLHLGAERLVSAAAYDPRTAQELSPEEYAVYNACASCLSIAEIAVATGQPIGVVRVLVGDLAKAGRVIVHPAAADLSKAALLERVLNGLQRL
jgi:Protein of unknown function (DUF742)